MRARSSGFTLIELLVVIAIIAILAAILFPIFVSAKAAGALASCQSNIKQIGYAMQLYSESNDGRLCPYSIGNGNDRKLWWEFINPYLKAGKIYRCTALLDAKTTDKSKDQRRLIGYGVPYPHMFSADTPNKQPTRLSTLARPSKLMLACDSYTMEKDLVINRGGYYEVGYPVVYCPLHGYNYSGVQEDGNVAGRHGGSSNVKPWGKTVVLYCDLHTRAWPKEYVVQKYDSKASSKNNDMWGHFDNIQ